LLSFAAHSEEKGLAGLAKISIHVMPLRTPELPTITRGYLNTIVGSEPLVEPSLLLSNSTKIINVVHVYNCWMY